RAVTYRSVERSTLGDHWCGQSHPVLLEVERLNPANRRHLVARLAFEDRMLSDRVVDGVGELHFAPAKPAEIAEDVRLDSRLRMDRRIGDVRFRDRQAARDRLAGHPAERDVLEARVVVA